MAFKKNDSLFSSLNEGATLTWEDLSVYIRKKESSFISSSYSYKRIINNVSGSVESGKMVAIMGPSGSGKSTILQALASPSTGGGTLVNGKIRLNGRKMSSSVKHIIGFMHQEDLFIGSLTVEEHLFFMAQLRIDRRTSYSYRKKRVKTLLEELGLSSVARTRIGGLGIDSEQVVISGGERKRLSFATECLMDPPLLICDEPTTGLDSYSAHTLVSMMKEMAENNSKTILCTIHQPGPDILSMFHSIILIAEGHIVFSGTTDEALSFFNEHGYIKRKQCSVGEFLVNTLAPTPGLERSTENAVKHLAHHFALTDQAKRVNMVIEYEDRISKDYLEVKETCYKQPFWIVKLFWMFYRAMLEVIRNPNIQWMRIFQKILVSIMAGLCYVGAVSLTQSGVQAVQGALFVLVTENTYAPMYAVLNLFPIQFPLFTREYASGISSPLLFYLTKTLAAIPGLVVEAIVSTTIFYYLVGLRSTWYAYIMITFATVLCINVSSACGSMFSTAFESPSFAMAYLIPFDYAVMITSGLFIKLSSLPAVTTWIQYISWLMYSYETMSIVQWNGVQNITCATNQPSLPCAKTGQQVLENYSFSSENLYRNIYAMICLYLAFHLFGYLFLKRKLKNI